MLKVGPGNKLKLGGQRFPVDRSQARPTHTRTRTPSSVNERDEVWTEIGSNVPNSRREREGKSCRPEIQVIRLGTSKTRLKKTTRKDKAAKDTSAASRHLKGSFKSLQSSTRR